MEWSKSKISIILCIRGCGALIGDFTIALSFGGTFGNIIDYSSAAGLCCPATIFRQLSPNHFPSIKLNLFISHLFISLLPLFV